MLSSIWSMQVFGKDSILNLGQKETKESRDMWAQDMDIDVSLSLHCYTD